jgi:hypothetical protein
VYALFDPFLKLCFLARSPQDLPVSQMLLRLTLLGYFSISVVLATPAYGLFHSVAQSLVELAILVSYTRVLLHLTRHPERLTQTLSALAGCGILLGLAAVPLAYLVASNGPTDTPGLPEFAYLGLVIWSLIVYGHIYRHALSGGIFAGFFAALGFVMSTSVITTMIFGLPQGG